MSIEISRDDHYRITNDLDMDIIYHVTTQEGKYKTTICECTICGYDFEVIELLAKRREVNPWEYEKVGELILGSQVEELRPYICTNDIEYYT